MVEDRTTVGNSRSKKYLWLLVAIVGFIGYVMGRVGHYFWGHLNIMHHWIPALIIVGIAPFLRKKQWWWMLVLSFGIGFLISDLTDFINLRFWSVDVGEQHFWGID